MGNIKIPRAQFIKELKEFFTAETGLTIAEAKKQIKEQMKANEFNTDIKAKNVRLFYTDNDNYCGGKSQGFGKGFYITNGGFTGGNTIKL